MITISKEEIREQLKDWGVHQFKQLEEALERELTDEEFKEMILYLIGYADYSKSVTTEAFAEFINLTESLSEDEVEKIKEFDKKNA